MEAKMGLDDPGRVWQILDEVKDPEIPVISVVELGLIREVRVEGGKVEVTMTPTFSGCPALHAMRENIIDALKAAGVEEVEVTIERRPWSSDLITPVGREKLRAFGLTPPPRHGGQVLQALEEPVACPHCGSQKTSLMNPFGSTLCRAIYRCQACGEPFERFKPL